MEVEAGNLLQWQEVRAALSEETGMWILGTIKEKREQMSPLQDSVVKHTTFPKDQVQ